jgi:hypothetical protein
VSTEDEMRGQLRFPQRLEEGTFVPPEWEYSFVYPDVKTEYNFVGSIPADIVYVRMQGDFEYLTGGETHHAAKVLRVPNVKPNADLRQADVQSAGSCEF